MKPRIKSWSADEGWDDVERPDSPLKEFERPRQPKIKSWSANEGWDDIERLDSPLKEN